MTVLIEDVFPAGVTVELLDAVTDEMGVDAHLPAGGILHVHFEKDGRAHASTCGSQSRRMRSSSSQRLCRPWARSPRQEASTRQRWASPK